MVAVVLALLVLLAFAAGDPAASQGTQIKFAFPAPAQSPLNTIAMAGWAKDVNAAAKGAIEVKIYPGPVLGTFGNIYDRTVKGVTDIAFGLAGPVGGQFPRSILTGLPFESKSSSESSLALWRLYANGTVAMEYADVKPLGLFHFPHSGINSKRPIKTIDDVKGMKMAVSSKLQGEMAAALGAAPVSMAPPDVYQSLNRGVIDSVMFPWTGTGTFKSYEVAKFHFEAPLGSPSAFVLMNKKSYDRLPAAAKQAIDEFSGEAFTKRLGKTTDGMAAHNRKTISALKGQTIVTLKDDDAGPWKKAINGAVENSIESTPDGAKVLAAFRAEIQKIRNGM